VLIQSYRRASKVPTTGSGFGNSAVAKMMAKMGYREGQGKLGFH
jgi:hypothetical protein